MATILGTIPEAGSRSLFGALKARFSDAGRLQEEYEGGEGLRRLITLLRELPDWVTVVIKPKLGFMDVDACVAAPGVLLVLNGLHWTGDVATGERGEWTGHAGRFGLGRPDRRAHAFADRLIFSGRAEGLAVHPAVICTAGPVKLNAKDQLVELVQEADARAWLEAATAGRNGADPSALVRSLIVK